MVGAEKWKDGGETELISQMLSGRMTSHVLCGQRQNVSRKPKQLLLNLCINYEANMLQTEDNNMLQSCFSCFYILCHDVAAEA